MCTTYQGSQGLQGLGTVHKPCLRRRERFPPYMEQPSTRSVAPTVFHQLRRAGQPGLQTGDFRRPGAESLDPINARSVSLVDANDLVGRSRQG